MSQFYSCAIVSQRPTRFKFKYQEYMTSCKRLKKRLHDVFVKLYRRGVCRFYVGGALGVDLWAGEILLRLKEQPEYSDIELVVVLPFAGHDAEWDARSKSRLKFLIDHSAETVTVGTAGESAAACYKRRSYYMVDHAGCLLAVYDNDSSIRSGAGMTVNYALKKKLPITLIHPDTAVISEIPKCPC